MARTIGLKRVRLFRELIEAATDCAILFESDSSKAERQHTACAAVLRELLGREPTEREVLAATGWPMKDTDEDSGR